MDRMLTADSPLAESRQTLGASSPMVSIIIPAYNEEAVIGRTLEGLLAGAAPGDLEIIVCCNGCRDRTAEIARSFGPPVRVLETAEGSKPRALNMGDEAATTFPRIYLDADILLDYASVKSIVRALASPEVLAVAPRMRVDLSGRRWSVRAFYNVWMKTPYHQSGMIGSGVYALSEAGRRRFCSFPNLIADDGFVRAHFAPEERQILDDCDFTVTAPATLDSLLRIKTRASLGNKELRRTYPELMQRLAQQEQGKNQRAAYWSMLAKPALWPQLGIYVFVKAVAAIRARSQLKKLTNYRWERDETSRMQSSAR